MSEVLTYCSHSRGCLVTQTGHFGTEPSEYYLILRVWYGVVDELVPQPIFIIIYLKFQSTLNHYLTSATYRLAPGTIVFPDFPHCPRRGYLPTAYTPATLSLDFGCTETCGSNFQLRKHNVNIYILHLTYGSLH